MWRRSGAGPEGPLVLAAPVKGAMRLAAVNPRALGQGLRPGLTLADARARVPSLAVLDHDAAADAECLSRLAAASERWSPLVALDPPDGLLLDVTGGDHLFGGEAGLAEGVPRTVRRWGFAARAAIAGTPDAARALVRFGEQTAVRPGEEEAAIRPLPVAALEPDGETRIALSLAGLARIGALADIPSETLTSRFGVALTTRLQRVLGREDRRITPLRPPPPVREDLAFAEPISHAPAIEHALGRLVERVALRLEAGGEGGRAFLASFFRVDGAVRTIRVETARPSRDGRTILRLLRERLDALADPLDPGYGFDLLRLDVPVTEPLGVAQGALDGEGRPAETAAISDLVDRLVARFGAGRVLRFVSADSHDPVRASRLVPAPTRPPIGATLCVDPIDRPPRPLQLFEPPHSIEALAEVPNGPPLRFRWRRFAHRVVRAEGPERIAPEWWRDPEGATRDYWRVEDEEGGRFWLFREGAHAVRPGPPRWFLHGLFP
jgi:protein ImuB